MDLPLFYNINIFIYSENNDKEKLDKTIKSIKNQQYLMYEYQIIDNINNINKVKKFNANDLILILEEGDVFSNIKVLYSLNREYVNTKFYSLLCTPNKLITKPIKDGTKLQYNFRLLFRHGLINYVNLKVFNVLENFPSIVLNLANHLNSLCGKQNYMNLLLDYQNINFKFKNYKLKVKKIIFPTQLVLATYKRNYHMDIVLNGLINQSYKNFELTLIDNNEDKKTQIELDNILKKYKSSLKMRLIRDNFNYHCMSRFYFIRNLIMKENIIDNVIVFDDDREFEKDWIKKMTTEFKPLKVFSWYLKNFSVVDYWKGRRGGKSCTYFGPGGSIIDASFFMYNPLFNFKEYDINVIKIDDIWGSFVLNRFLGVEFDRSSLRNPVALNVKHKKIHKNKIYNTFADVKQLKNKLFVKLNSKYGWEIVNKQHKTNTINNYFAEVYLLAPSNELVKHLKEHNITASYKSKHDIEPVKNPKIKILILTGNIRLSKNFIHMFDNLVVKKQIEKYLNKYENMNQIFTLKSPLIEHIPQHDKVNIYLSHPNIDFKIDDEFTRINDEYTGDGLVVYINNHPNNIFDRNIIKKSLVSFKRKKKVEVKEIKINKNINYDSIMEVYFPYYHKPTASKHIAIYDSVKLFNKIKKSLIKVSPNRTFIFHN